MTIAITEEIATKVRDVVDAGLVKGVGNPKPGQMCVEAAVCYALGLPHGDNPSCVVSPALRKLKIGINDAAWSTNQARTKGLRKLALLQLGSAGALDDAKFMKRVAKGTIQTIVPIALRAAAILNPEHCEKLLACADKCEREGTEASAREGQYAARAAAIAANAASTGAAACSIATNAAANAANAASTGAAACSMAWHQSCQATNAAANAANAASTAAYAAANAYAAVKRRLRNAAAIQRDEILNIFADMVSDVLIDMKVPGTKWLYLLEEAAE